MDLSAIVASAFAAIPAGVSGTGTLSRATVDSTTVDPLTDQPTGGVAVAPVVVPIVVDVPRPDRVLPPGLTMERARLVAIPAAALGTFVPQGGDTLTVAGAAWTVVESTPTNPSGTAPALYELLVRV